jgi:beta-N-acetylhexosaminidase
LRERTRAALAAGCDVVLHCSGKLAEMEEVAAAAGRLAGESARRADAALAARSRPTVIDLAATNLAFEGIMSGQLPAGGRIAS